MKISSNKHLLDLISKHAVGIKYPHLIPAIAYNIVVQRDNSIFESYGYRSFGFWFYWVKTKEGHDFWDEINRGLIYR